MLPCHEVFLVTLFFLPLMLGCSAETVLKITIKHRSPLSVLSVFFVIQMFQFFKIQQHMPIKRWNLLIQTLIIINVLKYKFNSSTFVKIILRNFPPVFRPIRALFIFYFIFGVLRPPLSMVW